MNTCLSRHSALLLLLLEPTSAHERENAAISNHAQEICHHNAGLLSSRFESRYFAEGRDNLDGDALVVNSLEYRWQSLAAGLWYGDSPDRNYEELQMSLAHYQTFGDLECYIGYTHLRFPSDDTHDHELGAGMAYTGLPYDIEVAFDAYHSFEADGFFAEASASREWQLTDKFTTSLTAVLGMNQGYVSDGHDGANHAAATLGLSYAVSESMTIGTHVTWSWALDRKSGVGGDEMLRDFLHAGVGMEWSF